MKTQSPDTSLDAELALIGMLRKAPITRRFAIVESFTASMLAAGSEYMRQLHPLAGDEEVRLLFIERQYGKEIVDQIRQNLNNYAIHVSGNCGYWNALQPLMKICEILDITYALGGSLASSLYGMQRATLQIDIVADLRHKHSHSFVNSLSSLYMIDKKEVEKAILSQTSFTLVHLESLFKIVISLQGLDLIDPRTFPHLRKIILVPGEQPVPMLAPEQIIIFFLEAFKMSGERADDLWYDLLGIMKVQATDLDLHFLTDAAAKINVSQLLERALLDAGLKEI